MNREVPMPFIPMPFIFDPQRQLDRRRKALTRKPGKPHYRRVLVCLAVATALASAQNTSPNPCKPIHPPILTDPPDANQQMVMRDQVQKDAAGDYSAANVERKKQISDDSARLLKLATELKSEVDKTTKDTLSLGVIRKADEIEKLAHSVKEKMKLTVAGN
jgi:hypothetical protein